MEPATAGAGEHRGVTDRQADLFSGAGVRWDAALPDAAKRSPLAAAEPRRRRADRRPPRVWPHRLSRLGGRSRATAARCRSSGAGVAVPAVQGLRGRPRDSGADGRVAGARDEDNLAKGTAADRVINATTLRDRFRFVRFRVHGRRLRRRRSASGARSAAASGLGGCAGRNGLAAYRGCA